MKVFKRIFVFLLIISLSFIPFAVYSETVSAREIEELSHNFFRLHIRANSDSEEDQALKLKVRDDILEYTTNLLSSCSDKTEAMRLVSANTEKIEQIAKKSILAEGYGYGVRASVRREYFERREYDGFFLPAGEYDSLIVELGSGQGHNWWCVLYPCVCLSGSTDGVKTNLENVPDRLKTAKEPSSGSFRFGFWIVDVFKSIFG